MPFASAPVRTPDGEQAATWTRNGEAEFAVWQQDSAGTWYVIGRTTYPTNTERPHCAPFVTGSAIKGANNAVFIVHECFAGDGSTHAAAIGNGPDGWGVITQPSAHRLVPSGIRGGDNGPASAIHWDMEFDHGGIATSDNAGNFGVAGSNAFPRIEIWRWRSDGFGAVADSVFVARQARPPYRAAPLLSGQGCPAHGTFAASFNARADRERNAPPNAPIEVKIFPASADTSAMAPICTEFVSPLISISVHVGYTPHLLADHYRSITNRRWITGPAWLLIQGVGGFSVPAPIFYRRIIDNPWYIPRFLRDNVLLSRLGSRPAFGTVSFKSGDLVSLAAS
jgi:hypothetical protein